MSRWTDQASWVGTTRHGGAMTGHRGLVVHIAEGFYTGTIAWQQGDNKVSSHFVLGRDGRCAQMVDTTNEAWAQRAGNAQWLSVECEGFTSGNPLHKQHPGWEVLSAAQVDRVARLLLKAHKSYGVPLQLATSPGGSGLGHHSMGADWGHQGCPGNPIIGQKPAIVARARELLGGVPPMVRFGAVNSTVSRAQTDANRVPNTGADVKVDGRYGALTEAKIKRVQHAAHLTEDGICGINTWAVLLKEE